MRTENVIDTDSHYRDFLGNRFVYVLISARARGLSIGVNMNPKQIHGIEPGGESLAPAFPESVQLNVEVMAQELQNTIDRVRSGKIRKVSFYKTLPPDLVELRQVALSGEGEPTLSPIFTEAVQAVAHVRARSPVFFKMVLVTNAVGLDRPEVLSGLKYFTRTDELWVRFETSSYSMTGDPFDPDTEKAQQNILSIARQRPVVIQGLFPSYNSEGPSPEDIDQYVQRLIKLKESGAKISLVQIYSAPRPRLHSDNGHLPLKTLSRVAQAVRQNAGLAAEIF